MYWVLTMKGLSGMSVEKFFIYLYTPCFKQQISSINKAPANDFRSAGTFEILIRTPSLKATALLAFVYAIARSIWIMRRVDSCSFFLSRLEWFTDFDQAAPASFLLLFTPVPAGFVALCLPSMVSGLAAGAATRLDDPNRIRKEVERNREKERERKGGGQWRRHLHNESSLADFITYSCTESTRPAIFSLSDFLVSLSLSLL